MPLNVLALNCSLKGDPAVQSSTDAMIELLAKAFADWRVEQGETIRVAALNILPGVTSGEGEGDDWPALREQVLAADIVISAGPIWLGQISSVMKRVLERMDAFLGETDDTGRMPSFGKIAVAAIVGNEDGAHFSTAQLFQVLNDVGWTIPATGDLLLGWRSDGEQGIQGYGRAAGAHPPHGEDGGKQCMPLLAPSPSHALPGLTTASSGREKRARALPAGPQG